MDKSLVPINPIAWWRNIPRNGVFKTLAVPFVVSLFFSMLVAGVALLEQPRIDQNKELNRQRNVLAAAGLLPSETPVDSLFEQVEPKVVDLNTGRYDTRLDPDQVLNAQASRAPDLGSPIPADDDIALIKYRPDYAVVYLVYESDALKTIVLPVYGYGLWSTLYGYLALSADANTIVGLRFYQQGETPGLGGEIDNPNWLQLWPGKKVYNPSGNPVIEVRKGQADAGGRGNPYRVDGISGATMTGRGVTNLLRYWLGNDGFGPYLKRIRQKEKVL